jgi:hypothetical protein
MTEAKASNHASETPHSVRRPGHYPGLDLGHVGVPGMAPASSLMSGRPQTGAAMMPWASLSTRAPVSSNASSDEDPARQLGMRQARDPIRRVARTIGQERPLCLYEEA